MKRYTLTLAIIASLLLVGCKPKDPIRLVGEAQGTYYTVAYYDTHNRNFQQSIDSLLDVFDQIASLWVDSSMIRRVNSNADNHINTLFADLLSKSMQINQYTEGAFDCRVGRLVQAWGFSFKKKEALSQSQIDTFLTVAKGQLSIDTLDDGSMILIKGNPATEIDFNAIAQGYAVDLVSQYLDRKGIKSYLVDIGGEVISKGRKADGSLWSVGVEQPSENKYSQPQIALKIGLENASIVTSGNYRKYYEKEGVRYSHTIDPETGHPVNHTLLSASVVDSTAWRADALATAIMVMGVEKAKAFIAAHPEDPALQRVHLIYDSCGTYCSYSTPEFQHLIIK